MADVNKALKTLTRLDPRELKTPAQKAAAGLALVGLVVALINFAVGSWLASNRLDDLPDCDSGGGKDCIHEVEGEFTASGGDEVTRYFAREGEGRKKVKISLTPRESQQLRGEVTGLFVDDDFVGFQADDGERYLTSQHLGMAFLPWGLGAVLGVVAFVGGGFFVLRSQRQ